MEAAKIVLFALAIFCGYGAAFGEVCSWLCPEAYTVARANMGVGMPVWLLGPLWGMFDFLMPAAGVGIGIALAAHVGGRPTVKAFFFRRPMFAVLPLVALAGALSGYICHGAVVDGNLPIPFGAAGLPMDRIPLYAATWWAMIGSQAALLICGVALAIWTWRKRALFEQMVLEKQRMTSGQ